MTTIIGTAMTNHLIPILALDTRVTVEVDPVDIQERKYPKQQIHERQRQQQLIVSRLQICHCHQFQSQIPVQPLHPHFRVVWLL
jgi:hypothetical protein